LSLELVAKQEQDQKRKTRKVRADETSVKRSHGKQGTEDTQIRLEEWAQLKTPSFEKH
jgi:hypothetical protein